jgi:hypothetical protein
VLCGPHGERDHAADEQDAEGDAPLAPPIGPFVRDVVVEIVWHQKESEDIFVWSVAGTRPTRARGGRRVLRLPGRSPGGRSVGRLGRSRGEPCLERRHDRSGRLHDQGRHRDLRPSPGAARRARSGRPRGRALAGVRSCRQGADPARWLLSHQAGLPAVDVSPTFEEACAWHPVIRALEAQKPLWQPGTERLYHAHTFGFLVGEVVRRITGKTLGTFFADEVAAPLGLNAWIGLPAEQEERVTRITYAPFAVEELTAGMIEATGLDEETVKAWMGRSSARTRWSPAPASLAVPSIPPATS